MSLTFEQLAQVILNRLPEKIKLEKGRKKPYMLVAGTIEKEFYFQDELLETTIAILTEMDEQLESKEYLKKVMSSDEREKEI